MYQYPKFSKNKVKQAFKVAGGWHIVNENEETIEFMPDGYKAKEGFKFHFISTQEKSEQYDMPIGEAYYIDVNPWVAVDWLTAEDFNNLNEIVNTANSCVKNYGKKYKF